MENGQRQDIIQRTSSYSAISNTNQLTNLQLQERLCETEQENERLRGQVKFFQSNNQQTSGPTEEEVVFVHLGGQIRHVSPKIKANLNIRFQNFINPDNVLQYFHMYDHMVLTQRDMERVKRETHNQGRTAGASVLFDCLWTYQDWFPCLLQVLRHPEVKLGHVAKIMAEVLGVNYEDMVEEEESTSSFEPPPSLVPRDEQIQIDDNTTPKSLDDSLCTDGLEEADSCMAEHDLHSNKIHSSAQNQSRTGDSGRQLQTDIAQGMKPEGEQNHQIVRDSLEKYKTPDCEKLTYRNPDKRLHFLGFWRPADLVYTIQRFYVSEQAEYWKQQVTSISEQNTKTLELLQKNHDLEKQTQHSEIEKLQQQIEKLQQDIENSSREVKNHVLEKQAIFLESQKLQGEIQNSRQEVENQYLEKQAMFVENQKLQREIEGMKSAEIQQRSWMEGQRIQQEKLKKTVDWAKNEIPRQQDEIKSLRKESESLKEDNKSLKEENRSLKKQIMSLQEENRSLTEERRSRQERIKSVKEERDRAARKVNELPKMSKMPEAATAAVSVETTEHQVLQAVGFEARLPTDGHFSLKIHERVKCLTEVTFNPDQHYDPSSGIFTVPTTGVYEVTLSHTQKRDGHGRIVLHVVHEKRNPGSCERRQVGVCQTGTWGRANKISKGKGQRHSECMEKVDMSVGDRVWVAVACVDDHEKLVSPSSVSCVLDCKWVKS